jgi:tRNA (guanine-N7-)-methyltransferase
MEGVMQFHPGAKPEFVHRVEARLVQLRTELPPVLPPPPAAITLEIGCGHGHFLTRFAEAHPERFCLGIDILSDRLERANKKRNRVGLTNVHFHKAEAAELLECLQAGIAFAEVFLLFPDPWPKKRHHKNRLVPRRFSGVARPAWHPEAGSISAPIMPATSPTAARCWSSIPDGGSSPTRAWPFEEPTVFQLKAPAYQSLVRRSGIGVSRLFLLMSE